MREAKIADLGVLLRVQQDVHGLPLQGLLKAFFKDLALQMALLLLYC